MGEPVSAADIDRQIQEFQQEQEIVSNEQQNVPSLKEQEEKDQDKEIVGYYVDPYLEFMNPMNNMIIIDLPWPKSSTESDTEE